MDETFTAREKRQLTTALKESLRLQTHYAELLNRHDHGKRRLFRTPEEWFARLKETGVIHHG